MIGADVWRRGFGVPDRTPTLWGFDVMKTLKTVLALITAALLPLALFAAPSSAATGVPDGAPLEGTLAQEKSATDHTKVLPPFTEGQQFTLVANFPDGVRTVTFYRNTGSGWQAL